MEQYERIVLLDNFESNRMFSVSFKQASLFSAYVTSFYYISNYTFVPYKRNIKI